MKISVYLILLLIITPILNAAIYKDSGVYGSIGLSYLSDSYTSSTQGTSEQENFIQEYKLGYKGIIYSPKLLDYSLYGVLRYEDITTNVNSASSDTKSESQDYKLNFNFLKASKIPFSINFQKSDRPTSVVYADTVNKSLQNSESYGISGQVNLNIFDLTYNALNFSGTYQNLLGTEKRDTQTYRSSIRKDEKDSNLQLNYTKVNQLIEKSYIGKESFIITDKEENLEFRYRRKLENSILLNTDAYRKFNQNISTTKSSSTTTSANLNLMWNPKTKHYGSLSIQGFNIEDDFGATKSFSISQSYGFRMMENLNISESANYNIVKSGSTTSQGSSLGASVSYSKAISSNTKFNTSFNTNVRFNSTENKADNNMSISSSTYGYSGQAKIDQNINPINSVLSVSAGYFGSTSSLDETTTRENASLSLVTILFSIAKNNISATYYKEEATLKYLDKFIYRNISRMDIEDNIDYASRIGINGNIKTRLGIRYSNIETDGKLIKRVTPKCDINLKYRLGPKLMFISGFHIDKDLTYNIMNYSFDSDLSFNSRYTRVSAGYNYNKIVLGESSVSDEIASRENHSIRVKLERKF